MGRSHPSSGVQLPGFTYKNTGDLVKFTYNTDEYLTFVQFNDAIYSKGEWAGGLNVNLEKNSVLELNSNHEVFKAIEEAYDKNPDSIKDYAELLYNQALIIEGFKIKDPLRFSELMCDLMIKSNK